MTSIVLADDHHVVRQALRLLLAAEPDLQVVGETGDGLDVTPLVARLQPDVLVVDLMMPGLNGLEVTRLVRERFAAHPRRRPVHACQRSLRAGGPAQRRHRLHPQGRQRGRIPGRGAGRRLRPALPQPSALRPRAGRLRADGVGIRRWTPTSCSRPASAKCCTWPPRD